MEKVQHNEWVAEHELIEEKQWRETKWGEKCSK